MAYTTINKSTDYFNTVTWTGTSDATTSVTGVGFQPDWVWVKNRDVADDHMLFDAVRGVTKRLFSNSTGAEGTDAQTLTSFDSDGFTTGNSRATGGDAGNGMVAWNWKANGAGSSNSDGSITSTVSANTTAGFSIVKYTGTGSNATIGHGLGVVPKMVIVKRLSNVENWTAYNESIGNTKYLDFDARTQATTYNMWQNTDPTSSVFYITTHNRLNASGDDYIAYCFADKTGYSKFGSYTGNGNADGTFVYTGFKPAFVIIRRTDDPSGRDWFILDNKRNTENPVDKNIHTNDSNTESTSERCDFLSNGFKLTTSSGGSNASGANIIYMAFGQSLVGSNNVPCTAR